MTGIESFHPAVLAPVFTKEPLSGPELMTQASWELMTVSLKL
jgi:hypothetical protein